MTRPRLRKCAACPRITRPSRTRSGDFDIPTTKRRGDKCVTCHERTITPLGEQPEPRRTTREIATDLAAYLRARRNREEQALHRDYATTYPHLVKESA